MLKLPTSFFEARYPGDLVARVGLGEEIASRVGGSVISQSLGLLSLIFYGAVLAWYDIQLTLICVLCSLLNGFVVKSYAQPIGDEHRRLLVAGRLEGISMSGLGAIETVKATGQKATFSSSGPWPYKCGYKRAKSVHPLGLVWRTS